MHNASPRRGTLVKLFRSSGSGRSALAASTRQLTAVTASTTSALACRATFCAHGTARARLRRSATSRFGNASSAGRTDDTGSARITTGRRLGIRGVTTTLNRRKRQQGDRRGSKDKSHILSHARDSCSN